MGCILFGRCARTIKGTNMLIIEQLRNGQTIVIVKKDWHPSRIGKAYQRPLQNNMQSKDAWDIQSGLLYKPSRKQS